MTPSTRDALPRSTLGLVISRGISGLGSTLTAFGLDVWIFRSSGSYAVFALLNVASVCATLAFAPVAGTMVDRYDKKRLLCVSDGVAALVVGMALILFHSGKLNVVGVGAAMLLLAMTGEMRWQVVNVMVAQQVPAHQLQRINGLQQMFRGATLVLGPGLAAIGIELLGLAPIMVLDLGSYGIGLLALGAVHGSFRSADQRSGAMEGWTAFRYGLDWLWARPDLRRLFFFMLINIAVSAFSVTFAPYVLSPAPTSVLGWSLGMQGAGAIAAGVALLRRRHWNPYATVLWGAAGFGCCMAVWGVSRTSGVMCASVFLLGAMTSLVLAGRQPIWQSQVPHDIQGKVIAARTTLSLALTPCAMLGTVPFVYLACEPLLQGTLWIALIWGTSLTGSLGLMVSGLGLSIVLRSAVLLARRSLICLRPLPTSTSS